MGVDGVYLLVGLALLVAVVLPYALSTAALSPPVVLLALGAGIGLLPLPAGVQLSVVDDRALLEHLAEITVVVALMGVGLAIDRPLDLRSWASWRRWGSTWRLLTISMPLSIGLVAVLGWWAAGLAPASALLLGAALAPTDPVLASDVQVDAPDTSSDAEQVDERDEVRFALTSEAGLNDGLAFPFVHLAVVAAGAGSLVHELPRWVAWDLVGRVVVGAAVGVLVGRALAKVAFRERRRPTSTASETAEPLLALAAVLVAYGAAEVVGSYGFLSVFACALTLRSAERSHELHALMHQVVERLERLLTLVVLLLLGIALSGGVLDALTWQGAAVGLGLLLVVRPLAGWAGLRVGRGVDRVGEGRLGPRERWATAFFGVRGIGSIYYLAYATGVASFEQADRLWSITAFVVVASVVLHGVTATPAMAWLDRRRTTS